MKENLIAWQVGKMPATTFPAQSYSLVTDPIHTQDISGMMERASSSFSIREGQIHARTALPIVEFLDYNR
jgi:hypothetical protein